MISEFNIETTVNLLSIQTLFRTAPSKIYQRLKQDSYALIISNQSHLSLTINSNINSLDPQEVFLCIPGDFICVNDCSDLQSKAYILYFQYKATEGMNLFNKSTVQIPIKGKINDPLFYDIINTLLEESVYDIYNYKPRQNILLAYLLLLLCRYHKYNAVENFQPEEDSLPSYVKIVLDYLESNYQNEISSLDIQEKVGLNYDYLNALFKKNIGTPIMKYLDNLRIGAARELLQHTVLPVKDIAAKVGIYNPQYFTKKFNLIVGVSPIRYRNIYNEKSSDKDNIDISKSDDS